MNVCVRGTLVRRQVVRSVVRTETIYMQGRREGD
jgi:hypothetical protein